MKRKGNRGRSDLDATCGDLFGRLGVQIVTRASDSTAIQLITLDDNQLARPDNLCVSLSTLTRDRFRVQNL